VTLEGSADSARVPPVSSASSVVAPAVVSEVALPRSPVASDAKFSSQPVNQSPPSLQPPGQLPPSDQPADTKETPPQLVAKTEAQDASLMDKASSSSPSNDVTSPARLTEDESSGQQQDAVDDTTVSVPVSDSS